MTNRLLVNPGSPQAWEIQLKPGVNRIGRTEENDFPINHQSISTHHCEITVTDTAVYLKDLGSTNGSFVERVPVTEIQLYSGQHVQFGAIDMLFESDMAPVLPEAINMPATGGRIVSANPGLAAPPPPPPPVPTGGLRINRSAPSHAAPPPPTSESPVPVRPISPMMRKPKTHEEFAAERESTDRKMFLLGICGAVAGGLVGMFGWYFLIKFTHMEIGYAAWGVGVVTGAGARLLARQGSSLQGIICAVCALFAILGGQYFALQSIVDEDIARKLGKEYNKEMKWAKSAIEAKTPEEITHFISVRDDEKEVTEQDIKKFNDIELPEYREFANGKPSKEEYVALHQAMIPKLRLSDSIGLFTILWSLMGIVSAWWIGSGNEG